MRNYNLEKIEGFNNKLQEEKRNKMKLKDAEINKEEKNKN